METKIWFKGYLVIALFTGVFLSSCSNFDKRIANDIEQLRSTAISIPVHQMQRFEGLYNSDSLTNSSGKFRMIVYIDSTECSPCALKYLYDWEPILDSLLVYSQYRETIFIFAPSKSDLSKVEKNLKRNNFKYPVFLDACNDFVRVNRNIPTNRTMHTFLIDSKDSVILVGNPLTNDKIKMMLFDFLKSKEIKD